MSFIRTATTHEQKTIDISIATMGFTDNVKIYTAEQIEGAESLLGIEAVAEIKRAVVKEVTRKNS